MNRYTLSGSYVRVPGTNTGRPVVRATRNGKRYRSIATGIVASRNRFLLIDEAEALAIEIADSRPDEFELCQHIISHREDQSRSAK